MCDGPSVKCTGSRKGTDEEESLLEPSDADASQNKTRIRWTLYLAALREFVNTQASFSVQLIRVCLLSMTTQCC